MAATTIQKDLVVSGSSTLATTTIQKDLLVSGASTLATTTIQKNLDVAGVSTLATTTIEGSLTVEGASSLMTTTLSAGLIDSSGSLGTSGQILSSTGALTNWIDTANLTRLPQALAPVGSNSLSSSGLPINGASSLDVQGNYAYVASFDNNSFVVFDVSDPTNPVGVGQLVDSGTLLLNLPSGVFVKGNYAYVSSFQDDGLQIIDISDPTNPTAAGSLAGGGFDQARDVFVQGDYAYVASGGNSSLQVVDVSDPMNPVGVGQLVDTTSLALGGAASVFVEGSYAYVASINDNGFQIIDISDPTNPISLGQLTDGGSLALFGARDVYVQGNYAYVAGFAEMGLQIINISNPAAPTAAGQLFNTLLRGINSIHVSGDYAYIIGNNADSFVIADVSDPTTPVIIDSYTNNAAPFSGPFAISFQENTAYIVSNRGDALNVFSTGDNQLFSLTVGALTASSIQVENNAIVGGNLSVGLALMDSSGNSGTAGQVLSSTGTSTKWVDGGGSGGHVIQALTASGTPNVATTLLLVTPGANTTISLPAVSSYTDGFELTIKRMGAATGSNNITIDPSGSTIDGATTVNLNVGYQRITIVKYGTVWVQIN
ncbi:hypothetical protein OAC85_02735 [Flavobacteriaceae bacterium]|nr:hypothetical protein [Flavobacteriaceae bacterium]